MLCKLKGIEPDDPWFEKLDENPVKKLWLFESWQEDEREKQEFARNNSIFLGSFYNMEMAQKLVSEEESQYEATDEAFEETTKWVEQSRGPAKPKRRRRRVINV